MLRQSSSCDDDNSASAAAAGGAGAGASSEDAASSAPSEDVVERSLTQRKFQLQELLESEKTYIEDLEDCVEYIKFMRETKDVDPETAEIPFPNDLRDGKDRMVFGNIEAIYEWHRE